MFLKIMPPKLGDSSPEFSGTIRENIEHQYVVETGRSDGTWVLDTTTRLDDGSLITVVSDLTQYKNRESELRRLSDGINAISNGLVFWDENKRLVFCNEVASEFCKKNGFWPKRGTSVFAHPYSVLA